MLSFLLWKWLDVSADPEVLPVGVLRSRAKVFFSEKKYYRALDLWAKVIDMRPDDDYNYYKRFHVYLALQKYKEALADLDTALTHNPENEDALLQRAKLKMRLGQCEESEKDLLLLKK